MKPVFSASSREKNAVCQGSFTACRQLSTYSTATSESGSRIHAVLEAALTHDVLLKAYNISDSTDLLQDSANKMIDIFGLNSFDASFVLKTCAEVGSDLAAAKEEGNELLWSMREPQLVKDYGSYVWSGHADLVLGYTNITNVYDWKSGQEEVDTSDTNKQMQVYAVMLASYGLPVRNHIVARANKPMHSYTTYSLEHIDAINGQLVREAEAALKPDPPRLVGDHCKYCAARCTVRCPESMTALTRFETASVQANDISAVSQWAPELKVAWLEQWGVVKPIYEQAYDMLKLEAEKGELPGYSIQVQKPRKIVDVAGAIEQLTGYGLGIRDIVGECSLPMGTVEAMAWKGYKASLATTGEKGMKKDAFLKELNEAMAGMIEVGEKKVLKKEKLA